VLCFECKRVCIGVVCVGVAENVLGVVCCAVEECSRCCVLLNGR